MPCFILLKDYNESKRLEGKRMASGLIGNEVPLTGLRVRLPCPPLLSFWQFTQDANSCRFLPLPTVVLSSSRCSSTMSVFCIKPVVATRTRKQELIAPDNLPFDDTVATQRERVF